MTPTRQGSLRLFRLFGVQVYIHWSWFFVAIYSISSRVRYYESPVWGALEYFALFLIVLMHEFGHALACRQVGGQADQIVLWPLGGVAYVDPPSRPGATLWSIAAGPLVNVVLLPVLFAVIYFGHAAGWPEQSPDLYAFVRTVGIINLSLLGFNLLPVYPLDGGQILRSLLWFPLGKARSLLTVTVIGLLGGTGLLALAAWDSSLWLAILSLFLLSYCWRSFQQARQLRQVEKLTRRPEFVCPACHASPPVGAFWRCQQCSQPFDPFVSGAVCPHCSAVHAVTTCPDCGRAHPIRSWDSRIVDVPG